MRKLGWLSVPLAALVAVLLGLPAATAGAAPLAATPASAFPEWVNFYGLNSTFNGAPLPIGAEVAA